MQLAMKATEVIHISIAQDFSRTPGGRYIRLGRYSGEEFREKFLIPHLSKGEELSILLDGTAGYGSSFLEEAFGGLVRQGYSMSFLKQHMNVVAEARSYKTYAEEIWQYVEEEEERSREGN